MVRKVAVISGGAGRIGFELCRYFCQDAIDLAIFGSSKEKAFETARRLEKYNGNCLPMECNVVNTEAVQSAMKRVFDHFGRIDILVSMQGWPPKKQEIMEITDEYWNGVISSHLTGSFHMLQQAVPYLEKSPAARVIFLASPGVFKGDWEDGLAYSAAKGGIVSLTYAAAKMLAKKGITVNCIATGGIHNVYGPEKDIDSARRIPLDNRSTLKSICKAVDFLIDEAGSAITGKVLIYGNGKLPG